jgi:hypothetical protein
MGMLEKVINKGFQTHCLYKSLKIKVVRERGVEPLKVSPLDPKSLQAYFPPSLNPSELYPYP